MKYRIKKVLMLNREIRYKPQIKVWWWWETLTHGPYSSPYVVTACKLAQIAIDVHKEGVLLKKSNGTIIKDGGCDDSV